MGVDPSQKAQASKGTVSPSGRLERKLGTAFLSSLEIQVGNKAFNNMQKNMGKAIYLNLNL